MKNTLVVIADCDKDKNKTGKISWERIIETFDCVILTTVTNYLSNNFDFI